MGDTNEATIKQAVEAFREGFVRAALEDEQLTSAIPHRDTEWQPGARLTFTHPEPHELCVRPDGEDGAEIEVIWADTIHAQKLERGYTSADELRERIETVMGYAAP